MEQQEQRYYYLDRPRNWSDTFSASFDLLQVTFRPLLQVLAKLVMPWSIVPLLGIGVALAFGAQNVIPALISADAERIGELAATGDLLVVFASAVVVYLGLLLFVIRVLCVTFGFLRGYHEVRGVPDIDVVRVHARTVLIKGLKVFGLTILIGIAIGIVIGVASAGIGGGGVALVVALVYIAAFACALPLLGFQLTFQGAYVFENGTLLSTMRRAFHLMRGRWWWTIGLGVVQYVATNLLLSMVYLIVVIAVGIAMGLMNLLPADAHVATIIVAGTCTTALVLAMYCAPLVWHATLCAATYFSLRERADGGDLLQRVGSIGAMQDDVDDGTGHR